MKRTKVTPANAEPVHEDMSAAEIGLRQTEEQEWASSEAARRTVKIKKAAGQRILNIAPEWKQRNMIARAVQLVEINGNRSPAEQAELDQYQAIWDKVSAIRLYSDSLEGQINAAEDPLSVDIETGWPT